MSLICEKKVYNTVVTSVSFPANIAVFFKPYQTSGNICLINFHHFNKIFLGNSFISGKYMEEMILSGTDIISRYFHTQYLFYISADNINQPPN